MNPGSQSSDNTFIALESMTMPKSTQARNESNILKNMKANAVQFDSFSHQSKNDCEPIVNIQRNGDAIDSIEFVCSCGKTKLLTFEYDRE